MNKIGVNSLYDKYFGCIFGALVADSCTSYVRSSREKPDFDEIFASLEMSGGGLYSIKSGELIIVIINSIIATSDEKITIQKALDQNIFDSWMSTFPPDIGTDLMGKKVGEKVSEN